jgi:hypothetical protein
MRQIIQPRHVFHAAPTTNATYRDSHRTADERGRKPCISRERCTGWPALLQFGLQRLTAPSVFESAVSSSWSWSSTAVRRTGFFPSSH